MLVYRCTSSFFPIGLLACLLLAPFVTKAQTTDGVRQAAVDTLLQQLPLPIIVDSIAIDGNRRTKPYIIRRELTIKAGDTLAKNPSQQLQWSANRLFNLHIFNAVRFRADTILRPAGQLPRLVLNLQVEERWDWWPRPIFELSDRNFNEWYYDRNHDLSRVKIGLNYLMNNFRGRDEDLELRLQGGFTNHLKLRYGIPYIDDALKTGLEVNLEYQTQKDIALRTSQHKLLFINTFEGLERQQNRALFQGGLSLNRRIDLYRRHSLALNYHWQKISDTLRQLNPNFLGNSQGNTAFLELNYQWQDDHRNVVAYPTEGQLFRFRLQALKSLSKPRPRRFLAHYEHAFFGEWSPHLSWGHNLWLQVYAPLDQAYTLQQALGYHQDFVRGYERFVMDGPYAGYSRNALRWRAWQTSFPLKRIIFIKGLKKYFQQMPLALYLKGFSDYGYAFHPFPRSDNRFLNNRFLVGWGLGLDVVTFYDSVTRLEYSWNHQGDGSLKIHFVKAF